MKAVEARVAIAVLAAAQKVFDRYGEAADPYMTMLAYFNSVRELAACAVCSTTTSARACRRRSAAASGSARTS